MDTANASNRVAVVGVCLDPGTYEAISYFMAGVPGSVVIGNLEHYAGADREIARALENARSCICFIDYDRSAEEATWITERLRFEHGNVYGFAVASSSDPEAIIGAMRAGCVEYLIKPVQSERVVDGVGRVEAKQKEKARSSVRGKIITVLGAKGGTGVTTLAVHLALELAGNGQRKCLLVDQHSALGDTSLYLGMARHQYSFFELASNMDRLDEDLLKGFLLHHESGLHLLDSSDTVDGLYGASPAAVEHTLAFLAEAYQFVVVDCPPGLSDATRAAIAMSAQVAVVMTPDLSSVRNAGSYIDYLSRLDYGSNAMYMVLNRYAKKAPLSEDRIEQSLGRQISLRVPNSFNDVIRAINSGTPISSGNKSAFAAAIQKWARELNTAVDGGETVAVAPAGAAGGGLRALFGV
jgi:pilus assembly protein CpaE